jgi:hypothetical protein
MNAQRRLEQIERQARQIAERGPASSSAVAPISIKAPADVILVLAEQMNVARADLAADPLDRARTIGMLGSVLLRAMDSGEAEARLMAVENVLKLRKAAELQYRKDLNYAK